MSRRVLVLGGTRFFGRQLVQRLLDRRDDVVVLTRGQQDDPFGSRVERRRADRRDPSALKAALDGESFVLVIDQLCFQPRDAWGLIDAIGDRCDRLILTSTGAVYGSSPIAPGPDGWVEDEVSWARDVDATRLDPLEGSLEYGAGKLACERLYSEHGPPTASLRIPVVVGPDDYTQRLDAVVKEALVDGRITVSDTTRRASLVSSLDAARSLEWMGDQAFTGPRNVVSIRFPVAQLADQISTVLSKPVSLRLATEPDPFRLIESSQLSDSMARADGFEPSQDFENRISDWIRGAAERIEGA